MGYVPRRMSAGFNASGQRVTSLKRRSFHDRSSPLKASTFEYHVPNTSDEAVALLAERATPLIGHFQIRSSGTIGGSVSHDDPAAVRLAAKSAAAP